MYLKWLKKHPPCACDWEVTVGQKSLSEKEMGREKEGHGYPLSGAEASGVSQAGAEVCSCSSTGGGI